MLIEIYGPNLPMDQVSANTSSILYVKPIILLKSGFPDINRWNADMLTEIYSPYLAIDEVSTL